MDLRGRRGAAPRTRATSGCAVRKTPRARDPKPPPWVVLGKAGDAFWERAARSVGVTEGAFHVP